MTRRGAPPPFRTSAQRQVARAKPALEADRRTVALMPSNHLHRGRVEALLQHFLRIEDGHRLHEPCDQSRPSRLMAGPEPRAVVTVEVLVEQDEVAPVRIALELRGAAVHGPPAIGAAQEDPGQTVRDLVADLPEVHQLA